MQLFRNLTTLLSLIELSPTYQQFAQVVQDICVTEALEHGIMTFIYTSIGNDNCDTPNPAHLNVPLILHTLGTQNPTATVINIDSRTPIERFRDHFNHNILSIVQLSQNKPRDEQLLQTLWQRLHWNIQSWSILLLDDTASEAYVATILKFCAAERAVNIIALQPHMAVRERSYWTLQIFPIQKTIKRTFQPFYRDLFPKYLKNMHGHPLRVMDNGWYPEFYNYTLEQGSTTLSGYMGRVLSEYAYNHNATIQFPFSLMDRSVPYTGMREALEHNEADIGLLSPIAPGESKLSSTSVGHRKSWCLMIPVEKPMPPHTFYYSVMDKKYQQPIMENCINVSVLQGLLGMTFWTRKSISTIHKIVCVIISLAGIILGTAYSTYLQSFSVDAPKESPIKTIDDVLHRGIKIAIPAGSVPFLKNNNSEFLLLRNTFDTNYAFSVTDMWPIYNEQQKYFSRPLFRISDICFVKHQQLVLHLQKNSVYRQSLNKFIWKLQEAGLISYWMRHSFVELLEMDVISLEDRNKQPIFVPLKLEDLRVLCARQKLRVLMLEENHLVVDEK
ncbi:uncharacterized protein LOC129253295 [Anastrepha obliqua]|uniref:uncharacterized protein LOC129253295 n=1 Tax=Anastrepha obliqua TaxID=95512 RepID=UPI00240A78C0|nr:uncharacterized protein LOC129253295 [Anastrepha obliqua]